MWNNLIVHMKICHSGCFKKKLDGLARFGGGGRENIGKKKAEWPAGHGGNRKQPGQYRVKMIKTQSRK